MTRLHRPLLALLLVAASGLATDAAADDFTIYGFTNALKNVTYVNESGTAVSGNVKFMTHFGMRTAYVVYQMAYDYDAKTWPDKTTASLNDAAAYSIANPNDPIVFDNEFGDTDHRFGSQDTVNTYIVNPTLAMVDYYESQGGGKNFGFYSAAPQNTDGGRYAAATYANANKKYTALTSRASMLNFPLYNHYNKGSWDPTDPATGAKKGTPSWKANALLNLSEAKKYNSNSDGSHKDILPLLTISKEGWDGSQELLSAQNVYDRLAILKEAGADGAMFITAFTLIDSSTGKAPTMNRDSGWFAGIVQFQKDNGNYVTRVWNATSAVWDNLTTQAWLGNDGMFFNGDSVRFDDTGAGGGGARQVTINKQVRPENVVFDNNGSAYTLEGSGSITGTGSLVKNGSATVTLKTANSYSGGTILGGGVLNVGIAGALGSAGTIVFSGGKLQYSAANTTDYSSRFSTDAGQAYAADTNGQNVTWASALSSAGGTLVKSGTGTLTLASANTYTGGTTVEAGTLVAGRSGAFGSGMIVVNAGGTLNTGLTGTNWTHANTVVVKNGGILKGTGTLTGAIGFASGSTFSPGNSPGITTFANGGSFEGGSIYLWEITGTGGVAGTDFDQIQVTGGTLTIDPGAILKISGTGLNYAASYWNADRSIVFAKQDGGIMTGAFTLDTSMAGATAGRGSWTLKAIAGNMVAQWTAIPEPGTYCLLGTGALAVAALVRRRTGRGARRSR